MKPKYTDDAAYKSGFNSRLEGFTIEDFNPFHLKKEHEKWCRWRIGFEDADLEIKKSGRVDDLKEYI